jgi:hypothetical protein
MFILKCHGFRKLQWIIFQAVRFNNRLLMVKYLVGSSRHALCTHGSGTVNSDPCGRCKCAWPSDMERFSNFVDFLLQRLVLEQQICPKPHLVQVNKTFQNQYLKFSGYQNPLDRVFHSMPRLFKLMDLW